MGENEMENISETDNKTVGQKVVDTSRKMGDVVVEKTETLGHDVKKGTVEGVTAVVGATETVARDTVVVAKDIGHGVKDAVTPTPEPVTPRIAVGADAVVA
jgi:hypothetical protein